MKVDITEFNKAQAYFNEINKVAEVSELEIYENGIKIEPDKGLVEEWRFIGLNNEDFIKTVLEMRNK